eukprot:CAMPEP_0194516088 /NCGR_PEP_ID=MMETSP0253-20130528/48887_1 /TAXON_ID=2966 /ORGANISM="Noctiluca scintillans" /LENGTH=165 /DNA_ID=CAMNT_0039359907 /DNA_START=636 /DNA_END=1130 /DNA_ORIENTATION=-
MLLPSGLSKQPGGSRERWRLAADSEAAATRAAQTGALLHRHLDRRLTERQDRRVLLDEPQTAHQLLLTLRWSAVSLPDALAQYRNSSNSWVHCAGSLPICLASNQRTQGFAPAQSGKVHPRDALCSHSGPIRHERPELRDSEVCRASPLSQKTPRIGEQGSAPQT